MNRIKGVRKKLSQELGFLVQSVHIRDNLDLSPNAYRITLNDVAVGESEVFVDREQVFEGRVGVLGREQFGGGEVGAVDRAEGPADRQQ